MTSHTKPVIATIMTLILSLFLVPQTFAQPDDSVQRSELGARQQLVERKMAELENRFTIMAEKIRNEEPERHQRLIQAYQSAKENLITKKMAEVVELLDAGKMEEAESVLDGVIDRLDELVKLLLNTPDQAMDRRQQIDQLEKWKKNIGSLQQEQTQQRKETSKVADKDQEINRLDAQIRKLDDLIERQSGLIDQTRQLGDAGLREMDKVADRQFDLRRETEGLAGEVAGKPDAPVGNRETGESSSAESGDTPPGDDLADRSRPGDQPRQMDDQSGTPSPGEPKAGNAEGEPSDSSQSESPNSDSPQSGSSQSGGQSSDAQQNSAVQNSDRGLPQPGQQALEKSAQSQADAEEDLGSGRPQDAEREQQQALEEMEQARAELKKERRRLASLPPEAMENMAAEQRRTRDKSLELVEEMAKSPTADGKSDQQVSQQNSSGQPGQQQVQQASESMKEASENLEDADAEQAEQNQQQAEQKLEEALEEIEERLNQLRDETREEKLRRLEARFSEMLQRQRSVSTITVELNDQKANLGQLQRRDQLVVLRLATEEMEIGELGQQAYDLLLEDGTSNVFPEMVQDIRSDLVRAAQLLQEERTGQLTQLLHQEIESALLDLLQALEESKQEGQQGGGGGGGGGDQPLLKRSAELKMLKAAQLRLNRKTRQLDNIHSSRSEPSDNALEREIAGLSDLQAKLQEMAEQIMEKQ